MPRNDEGEFELVLGNKQLLTVFFIVVILLGIFATMGYIVGRSTMPTVPVTAKSDSQQSSMPPLVVDPMRPAPAAPQTDGGTPAPAEVNAGNVSLGTQAQTAAAQETKPQQEPKPAASAPVEKKEAKAAPVAKVDASSPVYVEPVVGQVYIQVAALPKADADLIVGMLRKRSYPAVIAAGPAEHEKLHRVLVGPYKDAAEMSKVRAEVVALGFPTAFVKKY
jgi:cell division septation protein DedD